MDASTLAVITNQAAELDAEGRRLTVRGCSAAVARFIRVAGMDRLNPVAFLPASSAAGRREVSPG
jgi:anti-anti-sigma regulatory factor